MQTLTFLPLKMSPDLPNRSPSTYQELHLLLSLWSILCLRPSLFSHRALTWRRQGRLTTSVPVIVVAGWWREDLVHSSSQGALHIYPAKCGWTELEWADLQLTALLSFRSRQLCAMLCRLKIVLALKNAPVTHPILRLSGTFSTPKVANVRDRALFPSSLQPFRIQLWDTWITPTFDQ